jgi:phage-related baseplate assembly protein
MSDPTLAEKDPATVLAEALAVYKAETGVTLAQSDPRRLHLQALLLLLAQMRQLIDFSGKQSLLRFVSEEWIDELAALWGEERLPAEESECTQRFTYGSSGAHTVPAGTRVSDGTNLWEVVEDTSETGTTVDATVRCTVTGSDTNGVAIGQIDTLVDPDDVPGVVSVSNTTETAEGRDIESLEDFRTRLRSVPESRSTCGPRLAYEAAALEVSPTVADAVALGPDDGAEVLTYAPAPGEVFILILEGTRDTDGTLLTVVPDPDEGLLAEVEEALSAEDVRPLTDSVTVQAPLWADFDAIVTYYIGRSRSDTASAIQTAVEEAYEAYLLWQQSKIGRDINPSELIARLVVAGAKRVVVTEPAFEALLRDQSARLSYSHLAYGGVEDD